MTGHDIAHYVIGGAAVLLAVLGHNASNTRMDKLTATQHQAVQVPAPRNAWPAIKPDDVVALGESLKSQNKPAAVEIWCPEISCQALAADIDDAFQIAGWDSDFNSMRIDSNDDQGVSVGPDDARARGLADLLGKALGQHVGVVDMPPGTPLSVIIGHRPK
jgi:hypothetical protein